jgi:hypothetical protein
MMNKWKCSYGKSCECKSDLEKSECDLAYIAKKMSNSELDKYAEIMTKALNQNKDENE